MKNEFIPYEQALELKKLGFDEECLAAYYVFGDGKLKEGRYGQTESQLFINGIDIQVEDKMEELQMFAYHDISVPTFSQAFRWFREKHGLMHIINPYYFTAEIDYLNDRIVDEKYGDFIPHDHLVDEKGEEIKHSSYEEAELSCLKEMIEIVKQK